MDAGKLNTKIQFTEYPKVPDGAGGFIPGQTPVIKLETFASKRQIKASRVAENFQERINTVYELKLRKRAGFNPNSYQNVRFDNDDYNITEISEVKQVWILVVTGRGTGI